MYSYRMQVMMQGFINSLYTYVYRYDELFAKHNGITCNKFHECFFTAEVFPSQVRVDLQHYYLVQSLSIILGLNMYIKVYFQLIVHIDAILCSCADLITFE